MTKGDDTSGLEVESEGDSDEDGGTYMGPSGHDGENAK